MKYEKIKSKIDRLIKGRNFSRKLFYAGLNLVLLRAWHVRREIKNFFKSRDGQINVLDAGCGFGQYSYFIAKKFRNSNVIGVDINEERIKESEKFAREEGIENLKFDIADLENLNYEESFDLILAVDVLEHIENDVKVLKNFYRALKKDGLLIISTPSSLGGSDVHSDEDASFIEEHIRHGYSQDEIKSKLEEAGFEDITFKYTYGKFGSLSWKLMIKFPILLLGKSFIFVVLLPLYYLFVLMPGFLLMWLDGRVKNKSGTGLLVKARK
jgi:ubiquinone/menaquinone biosynthesis C-methylase UbiE